MFPNLSMAHKPSTICRCMYLRVPSMVWSVPTVPESPLSSVISSVPTAQTKARSSLTVKISGKMRLSKEKIAYIPDEIFYFSQATTLDMMHYYKGLYPSFDEQYFYKICKCFPMLNLKKPIRSFSKGTIKQVAFVLALSIHPALLVLDEPVDGLDPVMRRQIWSLIMGEVADRGTTILVSSHNLRELEDVCDHIGILSHGHIILERSLDNLQSSVTKVQVAFDGDLPPIPEGLQVLHSVTNGRVSTLILKGQPREAQEKMAALHPLLLDVLPLSLEEIFIYEMEGEHYEVKNILF